MIYIIFSGQFPYKMIILHTYLKQEFARLLSCLD